MEGGAASLVAQSARIKSFKFKNPIYVVRFNMHGMKSSKVARFKPP